MALPFLSAKVASGIKPHFAVVFHALTAFQPANLPSKFGYLTQINMHRHFGRLNRSVGILLPCQETINRGEIECRKQNYLSPASSEM